MARNRAGDADSGRRYRAYPSPDQADRLTSWGHTCRWLYNVALEQRQHRSQRSVSTRVSMAMQCAHLTRARAEIDWVRDLPAQSGQQVLRNLEQAYLNWWNPRHPGVAPTYKKKTCRLAVSFPGQSVVVRRLNRHWGAVYVPKMGEVRFRWSRALDGTIRNCTVSTDGVAWHVGFGIATGQTAPVHSRPGSVVGVDRGVAVALAMSDGRMWNRAFTTDGQKPVLVRLKSKAGRQEHARRQAGEKTSRRAMRVRHAIRRAERKIRNRRRDFAQWTANRICAQYATVKIEALNTAAMTRSAKGTVEKPGRNVKAKAGLNRAIRDKAWGGLARALESQSRKTGTVVVKVSAAYTSQRCNPCGHTHGDNRDSQAVFVCVTCGHRANADVNAAKNIRDAAEATSLVTGQAVRDAGRKAPRRLPTQRRATRVTTEAGIAAL